MYFSPHPNPPSCMCPLAGPRPALPRPSSPEQLGMLLVELEKLRREQKGGSPVLEASSLHIPSYLESPGTVQKHMVVERVSWSKCTCLLCVYKSAPSNPHSTSYDQHFAYEYACLCLYTSAPFNPKALHMISTSCLWIWTTLCILALFKEAKEITHVVHSTKKECTSCCFLAVFFFFFKSPILYTAPRFTLMNFNTQVSPTRMTTDR